MKTKDYYFGPMYDGMEDDDWEGPCDPRDVYRGFQVDDIDFDDEEEAYCESCSWTGSVLDTQVIGATRLRAGHPCPAGRCPQCDALAYPTFVKDVSSCTASRHGRRGTKS